MVDPVPHDICGDDARRLFFDRVGSYFVGVPVQTFARPRPCVNCGCMLAAGFPESGGRASCAATRSVSEKRDAAVVDPARARQARVNKDGAPAAARGYHAFNDDRRFALITPSKSWVAANVKPSRELPASMTFFPSGDDASLAELYRVAFSGEIETPALFIAFQRPAIAPYVLTSDPDLVVVCGGQEPVVVDVKRIRQILALSATVGPDVLHRAAGLRRRLAQSSFRTKAGMQVASHDDKKAYSALLKANPELKKAKDFLPVTAHEMEYEVVRKLTKSADAPAEGRDDNSTHSTPD